MSMSNVDLAIILSFTRSSTCRVCIIPLRLAIPPEWQLHALHGALSAGRLRGHGGLKSKEYLVTGLAINDKKGSF